MGQQKQLQGRVVGLSEELISVEFEPAFDGPSPSVADFDRVLLPGVQLGDVLTVIDGNLRVVDLGRWTQAELDEVRHRAEQRAAELSLLID